MKTLLINPPTPRDFHNREFYLPSGLLYLASSVKAVGEDVKVLDLKVEQNVEKQPDDEMFWNMTRETIRNYNPDVVGIGSVFSGNFPDVIKLSEISKEVSDAKVIIGGIHPTIYAEDIIDNCVSIDAVVLGEGEKTLTDILQGRDLKEIGGITFRDDAKTVVNPKTNYILDVDTLPFPAIHLVNIEDYYVDTSKWHNPKGLDFSTSIPIISSRSCPRRCSFCSMYQVMGEKWRSRSPSNVVDEIEGVYNQYGQNHFSFMDDNLTLDKRRIIDLCDKINERGLDIQFETPNGIAINTLDEEVLDKMVSAGFIRTYLAIESGSSYMRNKVIGKHLSDEQIYRAIEMTNKYPELEVNAFFIIGFPEETHETLEDTYQMIQRINAKKTALNNLVPFPGTRVYDQAVRDNLLVGSTENMYLANDRYFSKHDHFFLKPYNLELDDLHNFRSRCEKMIKGEIKYKEIKHGTE